ncbi:MAG: hypothetical protein HYR96_06705 [Deltaproteobacteria bacterium]|nr:hypothetical protein [Deltaproteobacteria bacterium]MBI3296448.1 hypothetical protein [Deltaproteobacteria bacterium]
MLNSKTLALVIVIGMLARADAPEAQPDFAGINCQKRFSESLLDELVPDKNSDDVGDKLEAWSQEDLDQLYSCLEAGPIPEGFHRGAVIYPNDGGHKKFLEFLTKMGIPLNEERVKIIAEAIWKGKEFDTSGDEPMLRNRVLGNLRFPAKVYKALSILDVRKDSIIIDYAYSEDLGGYVDALDNIATRNGLAIRDEIRMIRPGFYLGRAYLDGVFGLNFILKQAK